MTDIPLNKALAAVEMEMRDDRLDGCRKCEARTKDCFCHLACGGLDRKDGKNVIFRLVDLPGVNARFAPFALN